MFAERTDGKKSFVAIIFFRKNRPHWTVSDQETAILTAEENDPFTNNLITDSDL
jgi:hypothetical protein